MKKSALMLGVILAAGMVRAAEPVDPAQQIFP